MQSWVVDIFGQIPNREIQYPQNEPDYSIPAFDSVSKLVQYVPVRQGTGIVMTFPMPPQGEF